MIDDQETTNYFGASSVSAHFKNKIRESIWECLNIYLLKDVEQEQRMDRFYEVNRKICDTLDKFISEYHVQVTIDKTSIPIKHIEPFVEHEKQRMAHQIAEAIFKDETTVVRKLESRFSPEIILKVSIPFLKIQDEMMKGTHDPL